MKNLILIVILTFTYSCSFSQNAKKEAIKREVKEYREKVHKQATMFLNENLTDSERIKAIKPYAVIYDAKQKALFKKIVFRNDENPKIRAIALNKIYNEIENDEKSVNQVLKWFSDPKTPKVLREETLQFVGNVSFSSLFGIIEPYQKMINDPDIKFRTFVINKLIVNGDSRTQQLLIQGLENSQSQLLEPVNAIEILSNAPKKDYYPAVYNFLLENAKTPQERLVAIQSLGGYPKARQHLLSICKSSQEEEQFRTTALLALSSGDRDKLMEDLPSIINSSGSSNNLKGMSIQVGINIRQAMSSRKKIRKANALDRIITDISTGKDSSADNQTRAIATKYLLLVRPK